MALSPILDCAKMAPDLEFNKHVKPTLEQLDSTLFQMQVIIVRILTMYSIHFNDYSDCPKLQHGPRHPLLLRKTQTYPLRMTTINEAMVAGTIKIWHNVYDKQLKLARERIQDIAIPSYNDQLTNARIRGAKVTRNKDVNPFLRLDNVQLGYGAFHKCLNLVWAILKTHQGAVEQLGSLKYFFALLEKTWLGNEKPDYHTLLVSLMQILHGIILQAWRQESGHLSLQRFAKSKPTPEKLLELALQIIQKYATPMVKKSSTQTQADEDSDATDDEDEAPALSLPTPPPNDPQDNIAHRNIHLLVRDLLYVAELVRAISDGDWGRIEDILGQLTMLFRGAGSNNYSTELLHFLHNLKLVWGDDFG
jgi:hypothetical protein